LRFHGKGCYANANAPHHYFIRTSPILLNVKPGDIWTSQWAWKC
jgi:hypothetical protein